MADDDKDMLVFLADEPDPAAEQEETAAAAWRVLLVDDEPDVHTATKVALRNLDIEGRSTPGSGTCFTLILPRVAP